MNITIIIRTEIISLLLLVTGCCILCPAAGQEKPAFTTLYNLSSKNSIPSHLKDSLSTRLFLDSAIALFRKGTNVAIPLFRQAFHAGIAFHQPVMTSDAFSFIIFSYRNKGMYNQAYQEMRAMELFAQKEMPSLLPTVYNALANYYQKEGLLDSAMIYYHKGIAYIEKDTTYFLPVALPTFYTNLSAILTTLGDHRKSLEYLLKAEKATRKLSNFHLLALILINKADSYNNFQKFDSSIKALNEALAIARRHQFTHWEYLSLNSLAGAYYLQKKNKEALSYLKEIGNVKGEIDPAYKNMNLILQGKVHYALKDYGKAEQYFLRSLHYSEKLNITNSTKESNRMLSELYTETGQYQKALEYHLAYTRVKDSTESVEVRNNINQLEVKYRTVLKERENALNQLKIKDQEALLRKRNVWIGGISAGALFLSVLLVGIYRTNKHKRRAQTKQIQFLQQEQESLRKEQEILKREKEIDQLKAMIKGEEKERSRISRELHDGIGGMLSAINMNLNAIQNRYEVLEEMKELRTISKMLDDTSTELRKTAHNLMPDVLVRHNLREALVLYCDQVNAGNELQINLQCYGDLDNMDKGNQLAIYRIIQELIQNVIKHAEAANAVIQVMHYDEKLSITVEDNGKGFNQDNNSTSGFGLQNLQFRVRALNGDINIMSRADHGTTVYIEFRSEALKASALE